MIVTEEKQSNIVVSGIPPELRTNSLPSLLALEKEVFAGETGYFEAIALSPYLLSDKDNILLIAEDAGNLEGYAFVEHIRNNQDFLLATIASKESGRGVGTKILENIKEALRARSANTLYAQVSVSNPALEHILKEVFDETAVEEIAQDKLPFGLTLDPNQKLLKVMLKP